MARDSIIHCISPERALVLRCIRRSLNLGAESEESEALPLDFDWGAWIDCARTWRVAGLVLAGLKEGTRATPPAAAVAELRAMQAANAGRALFLIGQLGQLVDALNAQGIEAISFKGPTLSMDVYGNPGMRAAGDLDVLVRRADMPRARELLIAAGYSLAYPTSTPREVRYLKQLDGEALREYIASHSEHHLLRNSGQVNVDLHWDIALRQLGLRVDLERLWKNVRRIRLGPVSVATLAREDNLLVLCINACKDNWRRLDQICDIAAVCSGEHSANFEALMQGAEQIGASRIVMISFLIGQELLKLPLPMAVTRRLAKHASCRSLAALLAERMIATADRRAGFEEFLLQLRCRDHWLGRARYALGQCHPTVGDWAALPLPARLRFLHYVFRPLRIGFQLGSESFSRSAAK
jgi:hypothetical protein